MDDQTCRIPKKTDHTTVEAFAKRRNNHSPFKLGNPDRSGFATFTVNHCSGPVTYSSEGFIGGNVDALSPDFVSLLRGNPESSGGENSGSINPFIKSLFSAKAIAVQAHPRDEDTVVAAQQPVKDRKDDDGNALPPLVAPPASPASSGLPLIPI